MDQMNTNFEFLTNTSYTPRQSNIPTRSAASSTSSMYLNQGTGGLGINDQINISSGAYSASPFSQNYTSGNLMNSSSYMPTSLYSGMSPSSSGLFNFQSTTNPLYGSAITSFGTTDTGTEGTTTQSYLPASASSSSSSSTILAALLFGALGKQQPTTTQQQQYTYNYTNPFPIYSVNNAIYSPMTMPQQGTPTYQNIFPIYSVDNAIYSPMTMPQQGTPTYQNIFPIYSVDNAIYSPMTMPQQGTPTYQNIFPIYSAQNAIYSPMTMPQQGTPTYQNIFPIYSAQNAIYSPMTMPQQGTPTYSSVFPIYSAQNAIYTPMTMPQQGTGTSTGTGSGTGTGSSVSSFSMPMISSLQLGSYGSSSQTQAATTASFNPAQSPGVYSGQSYPVGQESQMVYGQTSRPSFYPDMPSCSGVYQQQSGYGFVPESSLYPGQPRTTQA